MVLASYHGGLAGFVCDALLYAAHPEEALSRRLGLSAQSRIERDVAAALVRAASEREPLEHVITQGRVPLSRVEDASARRFVEALHATTQTYRTPGIGARDMLSTIWRAFDLPTDAAPHRGTFALLESAASTVEELCPQTAGRWNAAALVAEIDRMLANADQNAPPSAAAVALLEPLPDRKPEAAAPIKRRPAHFSASALATYAECARKWYYRYVCAAVEDRGSVASLYGTAFHWALEQFHREFPRGDSATRGEMSTKLDAFVIEAFEHVRKAFPTPVEFELQKRRARRTATRYLSWFLARSSREPFEVIGQEAAAEIDLDGYHFVGYIDRLDRDLDSGAVTVVDYKTGSIARSAAEYRDRVARLVEFQLPFYYWARTAQGDRVTKLALVPLKEASAEVAPIELEVVP
ncbi:MAG: PD-(D/E)XK nuclease family protein, partial [Candidatus Eremiobacteraeota bacterium]|nr:PD-(D/E)XK nuclease family protein [Candidatus Eremiobacteraeota bacterium]